ncbi:MAG: hypothetical protein EKK40_06825 [Bradyrhizobiaceae bacterium]|nr:MAG: hypothetical protein EKK40_06825 [Bradyrhizobiaceae bacterium]
MTRTKLVIAAATLAFALPTLANAEVVVKAGGRHDRFVAARADMHPGWRHRHYHHDKVVIIKKTHRHD